MDKREFILRSKASGDARTVAQLATFYDTTSAQVDALRVEPMPDDSARLESDRVSAWLASLPPERFNELRRATFVEQRAAWVDAGSP